MYIKLINASRIIGQKKRKNYKHEMKNEVCTQYTIRILYTYASWTVILLFLYFGYVPRLPITYLTYYFYLSIQKWKEKNSTEQNVIIRAQQFSCLILWISLKCFFFFFLFFYIYTQLLQIWIFCNIIRKMSFRALKLYIGCRRDFLWL